ncbi:[Phe13]-bombesin receptor [Holothuria leucospilota]|uniref:[Phe13]-bombesin receptor n=1 Tax=Holothuria leucospilota TaxID=206669 RepID=A0A9Q1CGG2_HOLLE|nr:[Phe13]-bombesin receptor [Holothuria leucospilota]
MSANSTVTSLTSLSSNTLTFTYQNNTCGNLTFSPNIWRLVVYWISFIFGVFGNGILVLLFIMKKNLRTVNNILVTNMAFSDFLFVCLFVSVKYFEEYYVLRPFGRVFCMIFAITRYMSQDVSTMSMVALSYLRYHAIIRPLQLRRKEEKLQKYVPIWCGFSWLVGGAAAIFPAVHCVAFSDVCWPFKMHYIDTYSFYEHHRLFFAMRFVFLYLLPLIFIAYFYVRIAFKLCRTPSPQRNNSSDAIGRAAGSRKKVAWIILAIVVVFFSSWLPMYLVWLISYFRSWLHHIAFVILLPASFNPAILFVTSTVYRKSFLQIFSQCHQFGMYLTRRLRSACFLLRSAYVSLVWWVSRRTSPNQTSRPGP